MSVDWARIESSLGAWVKQVGGVVSGIAVTQFILPFTPLYDEKKAFSGWEFFLVILGGMLVFALGLFMEKAPERKQLKAAQQPKQLKAVNQVEEGEVEGS